MSDTYETAEPIVESHPTIKPTIIKMGLLVVIGAAIILYLQNNPEVLEEPEIAEVAVTVTFILVTLGLLRLLVRALVYTRTTYQVTEDRVRKTYRLLMRREDKEVPYELIRSHEFSQSRIESLLGYGTVKLNQGLGTLQLRNIESPYEFNTAIGEQLS